MTPLTDEQRQLVEECAHLVEWGARQAGHRLGALSLDDRRSLAGEALVRLARRHRPELGKPFKAFVVRCLVWQMMDCWRAETHRGRQVATVPLRGFVVDDGDELDPGWLAVDERGFDGVLDALHAAATIATVRLTDRERQVLVMIGEGRSLREIGDELSVSESRVCQIRKAVHDRLPEFAKGDPFTRRCEVCTKPFPYEGTRRSVCSHACDRERINRRRRVA